MIPEDFTNYNTIDNLPVETSTRRAQDMESEGVNLREAPQIAGRARVDVTAPAYPTQSSVLTGSANRNKPFPDFYPPKGYTRQRGIFTSYFIIPSLGNSDRLTSHKEKLESLQNLTEPENRQSGKLISFLSTLSNLTAVLGDITGSMNQFKKG
ncbi:MAG: DUF5399 family protein [Candidatus Algichlamydia australiensis]|nr:DUF5399 family protein [Chlamydiales bacterium]